MIKYLKYLNQNEQKSIDPAQTECMIMNKRCRPTLIRLYFSEWGAEEE